MKKLSVVLAASLMLGGCMATVEASEPMQVAYLFPRVEPRPVVHHYIAPRPVVHRHIPPKPKPRPVVHHYVAPRPVVHRHIPPKPKPRPAMHRPGPVKPKPVMRPASGPVKPAAPAGQAHEQPGVRVAPNTPNPATHARSGNAGQRSMGRSGGMPHNGRR